MATGHDVTITLRLAGGKVAAAEVNGVENSIHGLGKSAKAATAQTDRLGDTIRRVGDYGVAFFGGGWIAASLRESADAMTNLQSRLRLVEGSSIAVSIAQREIVAVARETHQAISTVGDVYYKMAKGAAALNLSQRETLELTRTISQAMALSGSSTESAKAALVQFGQAMASGVLRGEELNSVLEQAPALAEAIATGMGKGVGELRQLAAEGKLSVEQLVDALKKSAPEVAAQFATLTPTIASAFQDLDNAFDVYIGHLNEATRAGEALGNSIRFVADHLDGVMSVALAAGSVAIARWAAQATVKIGLVSAAFAALGGWPGLIATALLGGGIYAWTEWGNAAVRAGRQAEAALKKAEEAAKKSGRSVIEELKLQRDQRQAEWGRALRELRTAEAQQLAGGDGTGAGDSAVVTAAQARVRQLGQDVLAIERQISDAEGKKRQLDHAAGGTQSGAAWAARIAQYQDRAAQMRAELDALDTDFGLTATKVAKNAEEHARVVEQYHAARAAIFEKYAKKEADAVRTGGDTVSEALHKVDTDLMRQLEESMDWLDAHLRGDDAQAAFDAAQKRLESIRSRLDAEVTIGAKSQAGAQAALREETAALGKELESNLIPRLQELLVLEQAKTNPDQGVVAGLREKIAQIQAMVAAGEKPGWLGGIKGALDDYATEVGDSFTRVKDVVGSAFKGMEDALVEFVDTGKLSFSGLVDSILKDILRLTIQQQITGPLAQALSGWLGGTSTSWGVGQGIPGTTPDAPSAKGNIFSSPSLHNYVNQIHDTPKHFAFARGGVFAEAGPEAVMPLTRDASGRLGVHAQGGGNVEVIVNNHSGAPSTTRESVDSRGGRRVEVLIGEMVAGEMARQGSAMNSATRGTFGLRPQMVMR